MKVFTKLFAFCTLLCVMTACPFFKTHEVIVTTIDPCNQTCSSATCGCTVETTNNIEIKEIGICWGMTNPPTIADHRVISQYSKTSFTTTLENLESNKDYYVCGYAIANDIDETIYYGDAKSFTTKESPIEVTTMQPTEIEYTTARCGIEINNNDNLNITKIGICYGKEEMPVHTFNYSNCECSDYNNVSFTPIIDKFEPGETYHVRAFAEANYKCYYGSDIVFTMKEAPENAFLIGNNKFACFSPGNLQYQASTNTWRFAENQYDFIGEDNKNISETYDGWIDLFGWATSGYYCGNDNYMPYNCSTQNTYGPAEDLTGNYSNCDWGIFNPICNGGNQAGQWRTLTKEEWLYVMNSRSNASQKKVHCTINGINGVLIMPDKYQWPNGIVGNHNNHHYDSNIYSLSDWDLLEKAGAIFLPASGYRDGTTFKEENSGSYWTTTLSTINEHYKKAFYLNFSNIHDTQCIANSEVFVGCSVRLVKDVTF